MVVAGTPPIAYRWIRGGVPYVTSSVPVLVLTNNQTNVSIRVAATNIITARAADNRGALQFVAQTNKSYAVQYRTGLVFSGWSNFVSFSPLGSIRTTRVDVPNPPAEPARFYRVVTPMVP